MPGTKKILLVYKFDHPDIASVKRALEEQFPHFSLELLNIKQMINAHPLIMLVNIGYMVKEYPLRQLMGYWKIWRRFWATTYIHRQIKRLVNEKIRQGDYVFTFQMHSDFDAGSPQIPNFIYTDTTNLANLYTPTYSREKLFSPAWQELERKTYQNAKITFVRSMHIQRSLIEQYDIPREKTALVYSGGNISIPDMNLKTKDYTTKNILFVGVAWERKGGPDLIKAFEIVLRKHPDAGLKIVGCAPSIDHPNVDVIGKVSLDEIVPFYQKASIFCLPTRLEPFGIVFIEAMSFGLPLVAPRTGAVPDFVENGKNGFLFEPGDINGMATGLITLLDDPELCCRFGMRGYELVRERYTWQKVAQKMKGHIQPYLKEQEN